MQIWLRWLFSLVLLCHILPAAAGTAWLRPLIPGWEVRPLLTAGETAADGYRMAGIPDGLGAFDNGDGSFTLLMNHEIRPELGVVRAHGSRGAFISRWVFDIETLEAQKGSDLTQSTVPAGIAFSRLCSADLPPLSAFLDPASGKGYPGRLFMNGEEDKSGGRAFAHGLDGISYALPDLGRIAWENVLVHPAADEKTVVMGLDDYMEGLVLLYLGNKRYDGNPIEQAGFAGGNLYALQVKDARFIPVRLQGAAQLDGRTLRAQARAAGASIFPRPEDGAWDTRNANVFWFSTTDKPGGDSRLYRLVFDDVRNPAHGGRIQTMLRAADIGAEMFDNLAVDGDGRVILQEDPGDHPRLAAIWLFEPETGKILKIAEASAEVFAESGAAFLTRDEEHSGIIEVTPLLKAASWFDPSRRYYLGTTQVHRPHEDEALVEYGQLWLLSGPAASR
jgi:hypothetical protein